MRKPAIGPPTRLATTNPSVAVAMPTSSALATPKRWVMIGARRSSWPWPPMSEAEHERGNSFGQTEYDDAAGCDQILDHR